MKIFRTLWKNKEQAYKLLRWFQDIVAKAADLRDAVHRLKESVAQGDLDDLVVRTQAVANRRRKYVENDG